MTERYQNLEPGSLQKGVQRWREPGQHRQGLGADFGSVWHRGELRTVWVGEAPSRRQRLVTVKAASGDSSFITTRQTNASLGRRLSSLCDEVMRQPSIRKVPRGGPPSPGRDPKLRDGSGQRQQLIMEAPCVTHPLLPAKPRTAPCAGVYQAPGLELQELEDAGRSS